MNYFQAIHSLIVIKENHILKGQKLSKSIFYGAISPKMNPKFVPEIDPGCNLGSIFAFMFGGVTL